MDITIIPHALSGNISIIPSKSQAHRLLICAALSDGPTELLCSDTNRDIEATAQCLNGLGAKVTRTNDGYHVIPINDVPERAVLQCHDSGSTLRFLLPVAAALGVDTTFLMEGRLPDRPLSPLWEEMERMGCTLTRPDAASVRCTGHLKAGVYQIACNVSSQFVTGLLLALSQVPGNSRIALTGKIESRPYIRMTQQALRIFGCETENYALSGGNKLHSPGKCTVEGDWSNGAFFLAAKALGNDVNAENLSADSPQGDRAIVRLLSDLEENISISAADIPDLVPILSVVAACRKGAVFTDIQRLRLKESDRVASVVNMICSLGGQAYADEAALTVFGTGLVGGQVDTVNDHRIAMAAAIGSTQCTQPVTILGAQCVQKSYPRFWDEFSRLGGIYEQ